MDFPTTIGFFACLCVPWNDGRGHPVPIEVGVMAANTKLRFLEDKRDEAVAPELLRYRSNLLGSDLRITNFGGGNTSSKLDQVDPLDGATRRILWVKGSGGDLGSIKLSGFATLYLEKLLELEKVYRGVESEDEMVDLYPQCTFGNNPVAPSIDTPLHGYLPFAHVDHLHPDWGIALAASANGKTRMEEFNKEFGHQLAWLPWQRPGFELGMMLRRIVNETPSCDGVVLGGHGLIWSDRVNLRSLWVCCCRRFGRSSRTERAAAGAVFSDD